MRVFLGGTVYGYDWRGELISRLKCEYFNPIVKNYTDSDRKREIYEREYCDFVLYVITNAISGVYSIAEAVDDSNKYPEKTIFCNLYSNLENHTMNNSLKQVEDMLKSNGAKVFHSLEEVANFLNKENETFISKLFDRLSNNPGLAEVEKSGKMIYYKDNTEGYKITVFSYLDRFFQIIYKNNKCIKFNELS